MPTGRTNYLQVVKGGIRCYQCKDFLVRGEDNIIFTAHSLRERVTKHLQVCEAIRHLTP